MIVYGTGGGQSVLGEAGSHQCPACQQESTFNAVVSYTYFHIWYLFSFLTGRKYFLVCNQCQNAAPIDAKTTRAQFPKDNIPFIRKRGWMIVAAIVAFFVVQGALSSRAQASNNRERIAAPAVGDLYLANLARVPGGGFNGYAAPFKNNEAFGVMKLVEVDGDDLVFHTADTAYTKKSGARDQAKSRVRYDADGPVYLTREQVKGLHESGIIFEIRR